MSDYYILRPPDKLIYSPSQSNKANRSSLESSPRISLKILLIAEIVGLTHGRGGQPWEVGYNEPRRRQHTVGASAIYPSAAAIRQATAGIFSGVPRIVLLWQTT